MKARNWVQIRWFSLTLMISITRLLSMTWALCKIQGMELISSTRNFWRGCLILQTHLIATLQWRKLLLESKKLIKTRDSLWKKKLKRLSISLKRSLAIRRRTQVWLSLTSKLGLSATQPKIQRKTVRRYSLLHKTLSYLIPSHKTRPLLKDQPRINYQDRIK